MLILNSEIQAKGKQGRKGEKRRMRKRRRKKKRNQWMVEKDGKRRRKGMEGEREEKGWAPLGSTLTAVPFQDIPVSNLLILMLLA